MNLPEDQDYGLGPWLHDQNLRQTKGSLDKAKHDLLVEIGYEFADTALTMATKLNNLWNKQYQSLVEYKNEYGDTNVPCRWEENPSLGEYDVFNQVLLCLTLTSLTTNSLIVTFTTSN